MEQVTDIYAKCGRSRQTDPPSAFQVRLTSSERFTSEDDELGIQGFVVSGHGQMLQGLLDESTLSLEVICSVDSKTAPENLGRVFMRHPCTLSITVYGHLDLFDEIGSWFQEYGLYLQDPIQVGERDVRYCNPHKLSTDDLTPCLLMSQYIRENSKLVGFEDVLNQPDLLDILSSHADLEEAPQPSVIRTVLKR